MLTNEQLTHIKTRINAGPEDYPYTDLADMQVWRDAATLLDYIATLTTHNRVMQVALAQLSDKENWFMLSDNQDKDYPAWYCGAIDPIALAERALVGDGGLSHDAS